MKLFFLRFLLFAIIPLPFLFGLSTIVDKGLRKSQMKYYRTWNDIFNSNINCDILAIGASRTAVILSTDILDTMLHVNSYNIGIDGYPFDMAYTRFRSYLKYNKKPKYVILNLDLTSLSMAKPELYGSEQFLPYYDDPLIRSTVKKYVGAPKFMDFYMPLFKYNNNFHLVKEGIFRYFNIGKAAPSIEHKGYGPVDIAWDGTFEDFIREHPGGEHYNISKESAAEFEEFLCLCRSENIKLIMIFSPVYYEAIPYVKNFDSVLSVYKNYAASYGFPFLDYTKDSLAGKKTYFYNSMHLNKTGSEVFTKELANDIASHIQTGDKGW